MVLGARAARHQTVAEIDEAAKGHERKQDCLFEPHGVGAAGALFQDRALADVRPQAHGGLFQKNSPSEKTASEVNRGADMTVFKGDGAFVADSGPLQDQGAAAENLGAGMKHYAFYGNTREVDLRTDFDTGRVGDANPLVQQDPDGIPSR